MESLILHTIYSSFFWKHCLWTIVLCISNYGKLSLIIVNVLQKYIICSIFGKGAISFLCSSSANQIICFLFIYVLLYVCRYIILYSLRFCILHLHLFWITLFQRYPHSLSTSYFLAFSCFSFPTFKWHTKIFFSLLFVFFRMIESSVLLYVHTSTHTEYFLHKCNNIFRFFKILTLSVKSTFCKLIVLFCFLLIKFALN